MEMQSVFCKVASYFSISIQATGIISLSSVLSSASNVFFDINNVEDQL